MKRRIAWIALVGLGVAAWSVPAFSQGTAPAVEMKTPIRSDKQVSLEISDATAQQALAALSAAIGVPVVTEETSDKKITLKLTDQPTMKALDKVASEFGWKWSRRYIITKKVEGSETKKQELQPSGKVVTLDVSGVEIPVIAKMVAKAAGGTVVVKEVTGKSSLKAENMPVEQAMDTICTPVNAEWKMEYLLTKATEVKTKEVAKEDKKKDEPPTRVVSNLPRGKMEVTSPSMKGKAGEKGTGSIPLPAQPRMFPNVSPVMGIFGRGGTPEQISSTISQSLDKLFALPQGERQQQIQLVSERLSAMWNYMDQADPRSLDRFYQRMGPVFERGNQIINQLPENRRAELKPVQDTLNKILKGKQPAAQ